MSSCDIHASPVSPMKASATPSGYFSAFAIALGLSILAGCLNFLREPPLGDFHGEWGALFFFCCAALFLVPALPARFPVNRALFVLPVGLSLLLGLQTLLGYYTAWQTPAFWFGYLLIAMLAMLLGQGIRAAGLTAETVNRIAWALAAAALLNALAQLVQVVGRVWDVAPFVVPLNSCRPYGNIGQSNQAATLAWLGLASVLYLRGTQRLPSAASLPMVALLLLSAAMSVSRMSWLLMAVTAVFVVALPAWPLAGRRERIVTAVMLIAGFAAANAAIAPALQSLGEGCMTGMDRLSTGAKASITDRFDFWRQAIEVWKTSPWIGVGAFGFAPTVYAIENLDRAHSLDIHVHNLFLSMLAEFGIVGAALLALALLLLAHRLHRARRELTASDALLLLLLAMVGVHSLLEYPLWYTFFLIPSALALGLLVRPEWAARAAPWPQRPWIAIGSAGLLVVAGLLIADYRLLDRVTWMEIQRREMRVAATPEVRQKIEDAARDVWLFRHKADYAAMLGAPITADDLQASIEATDILLKRELGPQLMGRRAALAILAGDEETARWHLRRMLGFFSKDAELITEPLYWLAEQRPDEFKGLKAMLDEEVARRPRTR